MRFLIAEKVFEHPDKIVGLLSILQNEASNKRFYKIYTVDTVNNSKLLQYNRNQKSFDQNSDKKTIVKS